MTDRIELKKINLLGYTPETQVYVVQNAGGSRTATWLQAHKKYFQLTLHCGQHYYALAAGRIEKFKDYATRQGFEVAEAGYL